MTGHSPLRQIFDFLNGKFITKWEKRVLENVQTLRSFLKNLIRERKEEMKNDKFVSKDDFLSILLEDELFRHDEEMMIDECFTFMLAAT